MISEKLKRLRVANNLTQQQVADYLNISNQSISKWEKGEALPSVEFLPKLAELFQCSVNAFFSDYETEIFEKSAKSNLTIEESNKFAWELIQSLLDNTSEEIKEEDSLYPELTIPTEAMFLPALAKILREVDEIGISFLQRKLGVGYYVASQIVSGLKGLGVIVQEGVSYRVIKANITRLDVYLTIN